MSVDTMNRQLVGMRGGNLVVIAPMTVMTKREALVHAAWLVALAEDMERGFDDEIMGFDEVLEAVRNT